MANNLQETTFICPGGQLQIRIVSNHSTELCRAAKVLNARYFITVDGHDRILDLPVWGVFDMRTASKMMGRDWAIGDPIRAFAAESPAAAVMYALAISGRR